jgi:hypothetical protein
LLEDLTREHEYSIVAMQGAAVFIAPASEEFPHRAASDVYAEDYLQGPEKWIEPWPDGVTNLAEDSPGKGADSS